MRRSTTAREVAEGELFKPTAPWTATDVYDGGPFYHGTATRRAFRGELGVVANSDKPLVAPTEIIDAQATARWPSASKYNDAHRIILDDASSLDLLHHARTAARRSRGSPRTTRCAWAPAITFPKPVVFT